MDDGAPRVAVHRLDRADSTMDAAARLGAEADFCLVVADRQEAGRGSRGRAWASPEGNLYMTVAADLRRLGPGRPGPWPQECALLLHRTLEAGLPEARRPALRLKWPNDVLAAGRKVAGMLVEVRAGLLLTGIGVNLALAPAPVDADMASARLADLGFDPACRLDLAQDLFDALRGALAAPAPASATLLAAWSERMDWERPLRLRDRPGKPWVEPLGLNAAGHLRVRHADGREEWLVAEYLA